MEGQNAGKLNRLLAELGDGWLAPSSWLQQRGYSRQLLSQYVTSGWLDSPARGVFLRAGSRPSWQTLLFSLQRLAGLPLHVGGRHALSLHGHDHYLRMGPATVTLFGPASLPAWVDRVGLPERFTLVPDAKLGFEPMSAALAANADAMRDAGFENLPGDRPGVVLVASTPERALLELLLSVPQAATAAEADAALQGMSALRPALLNALLQRCESVKVKRLFLALAERHGHAWFGDLAVETFDLGAGKRALGVGERMHPKYGISLPADLDEQLG